MPRVAKLLPRLGEFTRRRARMGYEPIFLIVEEILDYSSRSGVPFS